MSVQTEEKLLLVGWASCNITPAGPVVLAGMPTARVSTGVMDPLTATALALDASHEDGANRAVILISCDLRCIYNNLRDAVRAALRASLPEVKSEAVILNATHTHSAPPLGHFGIDLNAMEEEAYLSFAVPRIAEAAVEAWRNRKPGGISFGLTHAVVGHNRLIADIYGKSRMYGETNNEEFSHVEGYEDHSCNLFSTWDAHKRLTGLVINVSMPSQVSSSSDKISADYWHNVRVELCRRLGSDIFILPQCSAAGDQSPTVLVDKKAEARMERLTGRDRRQTIAIRIVEAVTNLLPTLEENIDWYPVFLHRMEAIALKRRRLGVADLQRARTVYEEAKVAYYQCLNEIENDPKTDEEQGWYKPISEAYRTMTQAEGVIARYEAQRTNLHYTAEVHVVRIGDMVIATAPFELYVDYGMQIKARSNAEQTFIVQLAGGGSYVPTMRGIAGGGYGAIPTTTEIGLEGGRELVNWTVEAINAIFRDES